MKKRLVLGIALAGVCLVYFRMQIVGMESIVEKDTDFVPFAVLEDGTTQEKVCEPKIKYTVGHRGEILSLVFSPDGSQLATASTDGTATIWDAATGERKQVLKHDRAVTSVTWSLDLKNIATGSWDKSACIWDAQTGERLGCFDCNDMVYGVAFAPGNDMLLVASGKIGYVLNIETRKLKFALSHQKPVSSVAWSPDGTIATGSGSFVTLWNGANGSKQKEFKNNSYAHVSGFNSSGDRLLTITGHKATLWDTATLEGSSWENGGNNVISAAAFYSKDSIALGIGNMAIICDVITRAQYPRLKQSGKVNAIAVSPDRNLLAVSCERNQVAVWDLHCQK